MDNAKAAFKLGDYAVAVELWSKAAEQGNAEAQHILGMMHHSGKGVPQDYTKAAFWLRKAAEQGDTESQAMLGTMYFSGEGVLQHYVMAHMWFSLSAAQGNKKAVKARDGLAKLMTPEQIAEAQRLAREWKPKK